MNQRRDNLTLISSRLQLWIEEQHEVLALTTRSRINPGRQAVDQGGGKLTLTQ
ncbi:hypothetical protein M404DRAFT_991226 [Pisolithus tinctorius Marx 270]|uniref:Uncharacterized protein n=1 Tax=Pisolithus tinctorius Marx 270 TaxID=870435 RepID=A0A0C3PJW1_PISTI|nr:hypothetical protein M404DRAFT_991226 [Pisolithus tinctorius Marx 270]